MYQPLLVFGSPLKLPSASVLLIKVGYEKIPMKQGTTKMVPTIYHKFLFPQPVLTLSLTKPTIGVVMPSAIYPLRTQAAVVLASNKTILLRYQVKYTNHIAAQRSLQK